MNERQALDDESVTRRLCEHNRVLLNEVKNEILDVEAGLASIISDSPNAHQYQPVIR